jgi:hypothetical protein
MAIEIIYNSEFAYPFLEAYSKIENIRIDIMRGVCWIDIRIYANQKARNTDGADGVGKKSIEIKFSELDLSFLKDISKITLDDIKKACYNKIKENDLFKDGKDLL